MKLILDYKKDFELIKVRRKIIKELKKKQRTFDSYFIYIDYSYRYNIYREFEINEFIGTRNIENIDNEEFDRFIYELDLSLVHESNILWYINNEKSLCIYEYENGIEILSSENINIDDNMYEFIEF